MPKHPFEDAPAAAPSQAAAEKPAPVSLTPAQTLFALIQGKRLSEALAFFAQSPEKKELAKERDTHGFSALTRALLEKGSSPLALELIRAGAEPDSQSNEMKWAPLHLAAQDASLVKALLGAGANPNLLTVYGLSPLCACLSQDNLDGAKALLAKGAAPRLEGLGYPPALAASASSSAAGLELLEKHDPECLSEKDALTGNGALHVAASKGALACAQKLLSAGFDPKELNAKGMSPLHLAAEDGHEALCRALIEAGADCAQENGKKLLPSELCQSSKGALRAFLASAEEGKARKPSPLKAQKAAQEKALDADKPGAKKTGSKKAKNEPKASKTKVKNSKSAPKSPLATAKKKAKPKRR